MYHIINRIRKKWILFNNTIYRSYLKILFGNKIQITNVYLGKRFELDVVAKKFRIVFENNVLFRRNSVISMREGGILTVGSGTFFNNYISINCHYRISIGQNCLFGENVKLYDHNHSFSDLTKPISKQGYQYGDIKIGNNCWIGSNAIILKGVEIGDNVVIGAGCIIHRNIPSNSVIKFKMSYLIEQN